jgi:CheY-like chemotaxis protein
LLGDALMHKGVPAMSELKTASIALPLVLVADANSESRARRTHQLEGRGFRVAVARTPFEAIVKASWHLPDLILVDASLEGGADDASDLLATCPATAHIPIVRLRGGRRLPARFALARYARQA